MAEKVKRIGGGGARGMITGATMGQRALAAERGSLAWEMHKRGATLKMICAATGPDGGPLYGSVAGAYKAIQRELTRVHEATKESIELSRFDSTVRLRQLMEQTMLIAGRRHVMIDRAGRVVMTEVTKADGTKTLEPVDDDMVKLAAIREQRLLESQMSKLNGWNAPIQVEVSQPEPQLPIAERAAALNARIAKITPIRELGPIVDAATRETETETG